MNPLRNPPHVIREAGPADVEAMGGIYNHYVRSTVITFETEEVPPHEMASRLESVLAARMPWLVALAPEGGVCGFAYAGPWKSRCAYGRTLESTVYVSPAHLKRGLGTALYRRLLPGLRATGAHVVVAGIALPNPASVSLHEKLGFEQVAHFREVGRKFDNWIDVGYWQLVFPEAATGGNPHACRFGP